MAILSVPAATQRALVERVGMPAEQTAEPERSLTAQVSFFSLRFVAAATALSAGSLMADLAMPGVPGAGVVHIALLVLAWWLAKPGEVAGLAALASGLVATGYLAGSGGTPVGPVPADRLLALFAVWTCAALLIAAKRRERTLMDRLLERTGEPAADRASPALVSERQSALLSDLNHELRTPLNAIIGFSEIARREMFGPIGNARYRDYMNDINAAGQDLLALIEDLLDVARVETGTVALREEEIDVPALLRDCVADVRERAQAAKIEIVPDAGVDLPLLRADEAKVRKVVGHLLSNTIRFTPAGGTVKVAAWARSDSGYVIQVADSGRGIPLEVVPSALSPCGPLESCIEAGRGDQLGIGLPLAKALIELHGGSLDLQSSPGAGTTVTLRFPAQRVVAQPCAAE